MKVAALFFVFRLPGLLQNVHLILILSTFSLRPLRLYGGVFG
jgi:hypothetical protein